MAIIDVQKISNGELPAGGQLLIGLSGNNEPELNPIPVFTDFLFVNEVNPPFTLDLDGYPLVNGQRVSLYSNTNYSLQIVDRNGAPFFVDAKQITLEAGAGGNAFLGNTQEFTETNTFSKEILGTDPTSDQGLTPKLFVESLLAGGVAGLLAGTNMWTGPNSYAQEVIGIDPTSDQGFATKVYVDKLEYNQQTGTSYTVQASDINKIIKLTNASSITLTINTGLGDNFPFGIEQGGGGDITFAGTATITNVDSHTKTRGVGSQVSFTSDLDGIFTFTGATE